MAKDLTAAHGKRSFDIRTGREVRGHKKVSVRELIYRYVLNPGTGPDIWSMARR